MSAYFDWAATTPPDREILEASLALASSYFANPSSVHEIGKEAAKKLAQARERAARALGVKADTLVFTSGGTESDHLPMLALLQRPVRGTIAISAIEHPAVIEQAKMLECAGWKTVVIPSNREGFITPEAAVASLREDTAFIAVMAVNNETGAIQPIREIADAVRNACEGRKKPHFHVDAVQAAGKIPLDLSYPGIDSAAMSAHKIRGPRGTGLLYLAHRIEPFVRGGGQEAGFRPGTENLFGAEAFSLCLEKSIAGAPTVKPLMKTLIESLTAIPGVTVIPETRAAGDERFSPYIAQFSNDKIPGEVLVRALSDRGIFISTGSACSSKKKRRPVLEAMHVPPDKQQNAFRISIGNTTTESDIRALSGEIASILSAM
jgi:cysteine desulfurase